MPYIIFIAKKKVHILPFIAFWSRILRGKAFILCCEFNNRVLNLWQFSVNALLFHAWDNRKEAQKRTSKKKEKGVFPSRYGIRTTYWQVMRIMRRG